MLLIILGILSLVIFANSFNIVALIAGVALIICGGFIVADDLNDSGCD